MKEIRIQSFAKINLSIDVTGVTEDGMHLVDMVMHQLSFHDDVTVCFDPCPAGRGERGGWNGRNGRREGRSAGRGRPDGENAFQIEVTTNRYYLPTDQRNLAYKAAMLMVQRYGKRVCGGRIRIDIFKRIPVAAGLAGGSGNGAAVLHALNQLWRLNLSLPQLCRLGEELGSDVPFCVMGQAGYNFDLPRRVRRHPLAVSCARATGTGTRLSPLTGIKKPVVIAKPALGVSTREVYSGIDRCRIQERPDNDLLVKGLEERNYRLIYGQCVNVLEAYTLEAYPQVAELKELMLQGGRAEKVLMSGSGPTVFGIYNSISDAKAVCTALRRNGYEAYWTRTTK